MSDRKAAVITGATGMLGIALTKKLLSENYDVIAVVRPDSSRIGNIPVSDNVIIVEQALEDIESLNETLATVGIFEAELFFHFAWDGTHGDSRNNMDIQMSNVRGAVGAVRTAAKLGCKCFLGAGSQAEYGRVPDGIKLAGDTPCNPENGYGIGKYCAGKMTRIEAQKLGMKHIWVRILSTFGEYDGMHTMVMSGIGNMLAGKKASYTKGEQMWDYLYCEDAANAFFLAATKGKDGSVYPVGSGRVRPLADYIRDIRDAINPDLPIGFGEVDYYPGQVMYLCADIEKLTEDTGFVPQYEFADAVKKTVEWYKEEYSK